MTINNFYLHKFFFNEIKWNVKNSSALSLSLGYAFILSFKCQFVRGSFYAFVRFLFFCRLLLPLLPLFFSVSVCARSDLLMVHLFCLQLNWIFVIRFSMSCEPNEWSTHTQRPFTYFLFPVDRSLLFVALSEIILSDWRRNKCVCVSVCRPYREVSKSWYRIGSEHEHINTS